jgi:molybdopterin synthase sulfur carrier subunit
MLAVYCSPKFGDMKIKLQSHGRINEWIKVSSLEIPDNINTLSLREYLNIEFPNLSTINYKIAVNHEIVNNSKNVTEGDLIALLPPFSGG